MVVWYGGVVWWCYIVCDVCDVVEAKEISPTTMHMGTLGMPIEEN